MTRRHLGRLLALMALLLGALAARGAPAINTAADPQLEQRVNALSAELRCLVCQNQSLADSHADLAIDLKNQVRDQLRAGRTEAEVVDYMTQRYGEFVLYRPRIKASTLALWLGPPLLLVLGALNLWRGLRRRNELESAPLSQDAVARADAMLETPTAPAGRVAPVTSEGAE